MTYALEGLSRIRWGFLTASLVAFATLSALSLKLSPAPTAASQGADPAAGVPVTPKLARLAHSDPTRRVEVIVQLGERSPARGERLVRAAGGRPSARVGLINALAATMRARAAYRLAASGKVRAVTLNGRVRPEAVAIDPSKLATSFNESVQATRAWPAPATGRGVGVAVIDTGIAGELADFRVSQSDSTTRVVASAVTNPYATTDHDSYGHGTHVAGIAAGNSTNRASSDPLRGRYAGVAPEADLVSVKVSDERGSATVLDVIYGLQFAVDQREAYNIRVANLSLESTVAQSYRIDPLDAAAEAAWFSGIVVVAAAGNRGTASDAVRYAPGNDPYVITVGGVDDQGTKQAIDDKLASWSSRGTTQDGFAKPEVVAPGARIVSNLAPKSEFASLCASCIVDEQYIRAGGTSMAAPMVAGAVADMLEVHPELTPDQVKGTLVALSRKVRDSAAGEVSVVNLVQPTLQVRTANSGLEPNALIDPSTGEIDYTRSSWSRSSWSRSSWSRSSWSRSSWSCDCSKTSTGEVDPTRSSWSRSSWSTSWSK